MTRHKSVVAVAPPVGVGDAILDVARVDATPHAVEVDLVVAHDQEASARQAAGGAAVECDVAIAVFVVGVEAQQAQAGEDDAARRE